MNARERREKIMARLEREHTVYTRELCELFNVSAMTIRRDFEGLEKAGLVTLLRGGAAINYGGTVLHSLHLRETKEREAKRRIGRACAQLIQEGESCYLDCGSTAAAIAENLLTRQAITVLTASLDVAQILSQAEGLRLILVPGIFVPIIRGGSGQMLTDFMDRFHPDRLFLGATSVDVKYGLTSPNFGDAETKRQLIKNARETIVTVDHTKLGLACFERIARLDEISLIVTDKKASPETLTAFRERVKVMAV